MTEICLDSSIIISLLDESISKSAFSLLENANVYVSAIAVAELARYYLRKDSDAWQLVKGKLESANIIALETSICELAAEVSKKHRLSLADSINYASALKKGIPFLTKDSDFRGLKGAIVVK